MLDVVGATLQSIIDQVLSKLVTTATLSQVARAQASKALAGARKPKALGNGSGKSLPGSVGLAVAGLTSNNAGSRQDEADAREWFSMLKPDKGEEALDLILAHVTFVEVPVMAFVRLKTPIDAGLEGHAPVRYLFILLGPEEEARATAQMAHALAAMMLDESFVTSVQHSAGPDDFLAALDAHLEHVAILPHVHAPHVDDHDGPDREEASAGACAAGAGDDTSSRDGAPADIRLSNKGKAKAHSPNSASAGGGDADSDEDDLVLGVRVHRTPHCVFRLSHPPAHHDCTMVPCPPTALPSTCTASPFPSAHPSQLHRISL